MALKPDLYCLIIKICRELLDHRFYGFGGFTRIFFNDWELPESYFYFREVEINSELSSKNEKIAANKIIFRLIKKIRVNPSDPPNLWSKINANNQCQKKPSFA
jgi:hypothetical protein